MQHSNNPKQGEFIAIEFSPAEGHEQQGYRPALVLSVESMNKCGFVWVMPVTSTTTGPSRFVLPDGEPVKGAVLYAQIRALDCNARPWTSRGMASREVLEEALSCAATALGI